MMAMSFIRPGCIRHPGGFPRRSRTLPYFLTAPEAWACMAMLLDADTITLHVPCSEFPPLRYCGSLSNRLQLGKDMCRGCILFARTA